ncbi:pitrilysin family protein [Chryseobacterium sp.]|uniref:M16 family metallopeptidase n=1 Tax=Chryseobacterium sp. TaxID=1871047 RepID=UPI00289A6A16|nr:pitrilysin family protein [Chryseobacterium sp.]
MRRILFSTAILISGMFFSQQIKFEEYDLPNGLHVILHQDNTAPIVTTGVMYHVGAKDEIKGRSGFAHFFEHLLFEGTPNIKRGEWFKIVSSNGGKNNANTTKDRTYYFESFPSNNQELGLWMESERMRQAIINQIGVDTQREVVKEEKKLRIDNQPYGNLAISIYAHLFDKHPYSRNIIGSLNDLNSAKLEEFHTFYKKYYVPNNATLVVAGDIKPEQTKKWIEKYYSGIPKGPLITKNIPKDEPITREKEVTELDANIQLPAYVFAYRSASLKEKDTYALNMISSYLDGGNSSVMYKKFKDQEQKALDMGVNNDASEDAGVFTIHVIPMSNITKQTIQSDIDEEIKKLQTTLISQEDYQKIQNQYENQIVNQNSSINGIAEFLATNHVLTGKTNLINEEIDIYRSITRKDIQNAAKKYLNPNQRVIINYMPGKK